MNNARVNGESHQLQVLFVAVGRSVMHSTVSFSVAQRWISTVIQQMLHTPKSINLWDLNTEIISSNNSKQFCSYLYNTFQMFGVQKYFF